ncbi:hypothetical protein IPU70_03795 [Achromobacter sp. SD115]|uniref:hypothetical protein n=1 Tax=Achromobacter sp. SD115 TaxID=2782011 RepID=UPI001A960C78|nr:hypothetical protein [Achromobacter sp. SD115]MBO1012660.1 hypothetical protein [Achromobacter sp. SD115]
MSDADGHGHLLAGTGWQVVVDLRQPCVPRNFLSYADQKNVGPLRKEPVDACVQLVPPGPFAGPAIPAVEQLVLHSERYRHAPVNGRLPLAMTERDMQREHRGLTDAGRARDADRACALLMSHFEETVAVIGPHL